MTMTVEDKLTKAKSKLIMFHPFFASIICSMPMIEDNSIPTLATNGKVVKYNHDFVDGLTLDNTIFGLCHEVGHVMFCHPYRRKHRNPKRWNVAGDLIINDLLVAENIGVMPVGCLLNPQLVAQGGGTTDGVYDLLPDDEDDDGAGGHSGFDECEDAPGGDAAAAQAEAEVKVMMAQAAAAAKMCGKLSDNIKRLVDEQLAPKVAWADVLRRFVNAKAKVDYSYARPKRRFIPDDIFLPSLSGHAMGCMLVAIDVSGSIGDRELAEFAAELRGIKEDVRPKELHVLYFHHEVAHHDKFEEDDELVVQPHGTGGTAFSPIFRKAEELGIEPCCCVVLTDLQCNDFGPPTAYPTLWVTTDRTNAPWGEVIAMKSGRH